MIDGDTITRFKFILFLINTKNSLFTEGKNDSVKDECYRMNEYSDFNCLFLTSNLLSLSSYLKIFYRISSDNY